MPEPTPADELRAAAVKIRETAVNVPAGPWEAHCMHPFMTGACQYSIGPKGKPGSFQLTVPPSIAEHIALFDPVVAELVARDLDHWVSHFDNIEYINNRPGDARTRIVGFNRMEQTALDLARAINGSQA